MAKVVQLICDRLIRTYGGPWGSIVVLVRDPHQEYINDIEDLFGIRTSHIADYIQSQNYSNFTFLVVMILSLFWAVALLPVG